MSKFIKLFEHYTIDSVLKVHRLPKTPLKDSYEEITSENIELQHMGDDGKSIINFDTLINGEIENAIVFDIQLINGVLYNPHIKIHSSIQNKGLGKKIYEKFIKSYGHIYSSKGRRMSKKIEKIFKYLDTLENIKVYKNYRGDYLAIYKENPNYDEIVNFFENMF